MWCRLSTRALVTSLGAGGNYRRAPIIGVMARPCIMMSAIGRMAAKQLWRQGGYRRCVTCETSHQPHN
eukprot:scaffold99889_cov29-Tisochrysis_lutea.AAC.2